MSNKVIEEMNKFDQMIKVARYKSLNKMAKEGAIVFTGSSLMEQFSVNELCMNHGINKVIYNRGIGGFTTDDFLQNIDVMLLDLKPSKVFINIGTNDLNSSENALQHLFKNYDMIAARMKKELPQAEVYLMAYYPVNPDGHHDMEWAKRVLANRTKKCIDEANENVKKLAEKYGYNYINVNDGLTDENGNLKIEYTVEGIHMYPVAYNIVLNNLEKYL